MRLRALSLVAALGAVTALGACTPEPTVSVSPATGLSDGQTVTVTGRGYSATASVGILQCPTDATAPDQCDGRTADSFSTDAAGRFTRRLDVRRAITDAHDVVTDCAVPDACAVISVYVHGFQGRAAAPLRFSP
jgi:hypothetical protein